MSDAKNRLQEALNKAKSKKVPKAPVVSERKTSPPKRQSTPPAPKKIEAPKPKAKKKTPKSKKSAGSNSALFKNIQNFASTVIDELKTATSEIAPSALFATANDGLKTLRKAVRFEKGDAPAPASESAPQVSENSRPEPAPSAAPPPDVPAPNPAPQQNQQYTSPAKVQHVASKKKTSEDQPIPSAQAESASLPEPSAAAPKEFTSPAKVQRAASKQRDTEEDPDLVEEPARELPEEDISERTPAQADLSIGQQKPSGESPPAESPSPKKPARKMPQPAISREEQAVRSFRALQTVLTNPIWAPIITDANVKPSSLYAPRAQFDANFGNPVFREGLKAASRLAGISALPPDKVSFNPKTIQQVAVFDIDPQEKIKPHTEILTSALDEDTVKKILAMMQDKPVKYLLFSVGARLGSFVPTLEMLARVYLGMRKKEPITSSDRLKIQADILMRYQKAPYTEDMAQKARNLAVNYFMDYLSNYAIKEYKEGQKTAPRDMDNTESHQRRHAALINSCCNTIDEWGQKIALSATAVSSVKAKFHEAADHLFQQAADPSEIISQPEHRG